MKKDWIIFTVGICSLLLTVWLGTNQIVPVFSSNQPNRALTLIIDAGHGGEDGGTSTPSGYPESLINLAIVQKLDALLHFCGTEAALTREEDISLHDSNCSTLREKKVSDLKNRVKFVESHENGLLISVHQNHFTDPTFQGAQVFYSLNDISRQWGERTQSILRQTLNPDNGRTAKLLPDSIYLFQHISCPAILVECGFLSNGEEASLLMTEDYQRKVAMALTGACLQQLFTLQEYSGGMLYG